jgi:putative FmdB family regulatory protein
MPIYEYECTECGTIVEKMHKISEVPEINCPKCSSLMRKLISPSAFHLKGSGWYVTDYAKKNSSSVNDKNKRITKDSSTSNGSCPSCTNGCNVKAANE